MIAAHDLTDHEQAHRAAYRRARRIQLLDHGASAATVVLAAAAVATTSLVWLGLAAAVWLGLWGWRRYGHLDNPDVREVAACRAEYAAHWARTYAENSGPAPDDDPHGSELCARIDRIEARLPWWVRS